MPTKDPAQYFVREHYDRPITRKEFLHLRDAELSTSYITRRELLKAKTFTNAELNQYLKSGMCSLIKHRGKEYFIREELQKVIKSEASKRPPRQASLF